MINNDFSCRKLCVSYSVLAIFKAVCHKMVHSQNVKGLKRDTFLKVKGQETNIFGWFKNKKILWFPWCKSTTFIICFLWCPHPFTLWTSDFNFKPWLLWWHHQGDFIRELESMLKAAKDRGTWLNLLCTAVAVKKKKNELMPFDQNTHDKTILPPLY